MPRQKATVDELRREYSNYDQQVEIVCCWHSWYENKVPGSEFDRFPKRDSPDGRQLTPDFCVDFPAEGYTLVGEVCRLPDHDDGFRRKVARASSYQFLAELADVALLVPVADGAECELRIREQDLLPDDEPPVLMGYARDSLDVDECWKFMRTSAGRSARFRDDFLGPELSLAQKVCDRMKALRIPVRFCAANKQCYPFINDEPPAIYSAVYLRMKVLPVLGKREDFILGRIADEDVSVTTTVQALRDVCESTLNVVMRNDWIRAGLDLLCEAGLASRKGTEYKVHLSKLKAAKSGDRDFVHQLAERVGVPSEPADASQEQTVLELE